MNSTSVTNHVPERDTFRNYISIWGKFRKYTLVWGVIAIVGTVHIARSFAELVALLAAVTVWLVVTNLAIYKSVKKKRPFISLIIPSIGIAGIVWSMMVWRGIHMSQPGMTYMSLVVFGICMPVCAWWENYVIRVVNCGTSNFTTRIIFALAFAIFFLIAMVSISPGIIIGAQQ